MSPPRIVSLSDQPDLVTVVSRWLWKEFSEWEGFSLLQTMQHVAVAAPPGQAVPQRFVLIADGLPQGTASLTAQDLAARPDLTPWLASVYVRPAGRRRGFASALVRQVEQAAREAAVPTLWLYTRSAEGLYAGLGWQVVERFMRHDASHALMRRDLAD